MAGVNMPTGKKEDSLDVALKGIAAYGTLSDAMARRAKSIQDEQNAKKPETTEG